MTLKPSEQGNNASVIVGTERFEAKDVSSDAPIGSKTNNTCQAAEQIVGERKRDNNPKPAIFPPGGRITRIVEPNLTRKDMFDVEVEDGLA